MSYLWLKDGLREQLKYNPCEKMTSEELEPYISTLKKVGLFHKIHILSFLQVELKLKLKNP
jgi:hypothetical protein